MIEAGIHTQEAVSVDTLLWAISSLCGVVMIMGGYFVKRTEQERAERRVKNEQERADYKEERAILLNIVRENTAAFSRFEQAVERLQRTMDTYIHQER